MVNVAIAISALLVHAASGALPGQCKTNKDCTKFGQGYSCVSVQTNIPGITLASQCVQGSACGGNNPGKCPTFSSWSGNFQKIQPVCAFAAAANCNNPISASDNSTTTAAPTDDPDADPSSTKAPSTVDCFAAAFTHENETVEVNGIYKCIDSVLYVNQNLGAIANLTATQMEACKGDASTGGQLCNGHGTCAASSSLSSVYKCVCSQGYSSDDNCLNATSNVCDSFGSCGLGNLCDAESSQCNCSSGTTGPQCSLCDPESTSACNANGKCNSDGTCTCNEGYIGSLCQKFNTTSSGGGSGGTGGTNTSPDKKSGAITHRVAGIAAALSALLLVIY